jgi:CRISPR-associated endoribonuclease Cas6
MGLPRPQKGQTAVTANAPAWFRIATLDPRLTQSFLETWLTRLPAQIELAGLPWTVQTIALGPGQHPWAGQTSCEALTEQSRQAPPRPKWTLAFHTPTAFRSGENSHLPFPLPDSLVRSWLRRWNAFAPVPLRLPDNACARLRDNLYISAYNLKTVPVRHGRRLEIGCVGKLTLNGRRLTPQDQSLITLLTRYAFYCGSGFHTAQGMGVTISEKIMKDEL